MVLRSMYRPPNTDTDQFTTIICDIVSKIMNVTGKLQPEIVISMDHNMDLLKGQFHTPTNKFMEELSELNLLPTITRLSHITNHSATLIDNIHVSKVLH